MTIPRTWYNGQASMPVSGGLPSFSSANAASLDASIQQAVDKSNLGDTLLGNLTVAAGGQLLASSDTSSIVSGANNITTASNGRIQCGHGDFPSFEVLTPITRVPNVGFYEQFNNIAGTTAIPWPIANFLLTWGWFSQGPNDSPFSGYWDGTNYSQVPNGAAVIPLTRIHDGATLEEVTIYFMVNTGRTVRPLRYPAMNVWQFDPFLGVATSITTNGGANGWYFFPGSGSLSAWKGNHNFTATVGKPIDVSNYLYFVTLLDESYNEAPPTISGDLHAPTEYCGIALNYSVPTMQFQ